MGKDAILYARVSTERQAEEGYGLDYQLRELRKWADAEGYSVVAEVREPGMSRESYKRPGLDEIRAAAGSGFRGDVLAWKRDRYFSDIGYRALFESEMGASGIQLRAMNDAGSDTATDEFTDSIKDLISRLEIRTTAERTRAGKRERAMNGHYVWSGIPPYGYLYADGQLKPDPYKAGHVKRIFEIVGREGRGLNQVVKEFASRGIPSPRGAATWTAGTVSRIVDNEIYLSRSYEEVAGLVPPVVAERLEPGRSYAVTHFNQRRTRASHSLTGKNRAVSFNPEKEWIAVPAPDLKIPPEWVHRARASKSTKKKWDQNNDRVWPLRGIAYCPCGLQLVAYYNLHKGHKNIYMVCPHRRASHRSCEESRYHRAVPLEDRVGAANKNLLYDPETLRASVEAQVEEERERLLGAADEIAHLARRLAELDTKRRRYLDQHAEGILQSTDELKALLRPLEEERSTLEANVERLGDKSTRLKELEALPGCVEDFLSELPHFVDYKPIIRDYETLPSPRKPHVLSKEDFRAKSREELEREKLEAGEERARRFRSVYDKLELRVVAHKDQSVELTGIFGSGLLQPSG